MTDEQLQEFLQALKKERPYLLDIDSFLNEIDNGIVVITVRIYKNKVSDIVLQKSKRIVYK